LDGKYIVSMGAGFSVLFFSQPKMLKANRIGINFKHFIR
jgi:hypothetical protein